MDNEGVAFGDYLNHFPQENTIILNSQFSILNYLSFRRNDKLEFSDLPERELYIIIA